MTKSKTPPNTRIEEAYRTLMLLLFGEVPADPRKRQIDRPTYDAKMRQVQADYKLVEGDPDFMEWVLTLIGRSPQFKKEGEVPNVES